MSRMESKKLMLILALLLLPAMLVALMMGPVMISPTRVLAVFANMMRVAVDSSASGQVDAGQLSMQQDSMILFAIRLPRVILASLVGVCLAVCGTAMQGLFRNPLADPSLIGVSSGASAGASFAIVFGGLWLESSSFFGLSLVAGGAFLGGFFAVILVYRLATSTTGTSVSTMLLAGIAISALAGALNSSLSFFADNDMLRRISLWQMGSLDAANWQRVFIAGLVTLALIVFLPRQSRALNALLLGESEARHLGVDVERVKRGIIFLTALGVGASVAVAGTISFVGLIIPHIIRMLIGPDHRFLIPGTAMAGAILLVIADGLARVVVAPAELPAGILTALLGAPFFFSLLVQRRHRVMR